MSGAAISSMIAGSKLLPQKSLNQRTTTALLSSTDMESPSWWGSRRGGGGGVAVRSRPHLINATATDYVSPRPGGRGAGVRALGAPPPRWRMRHVAPASTDGERPPVH